MNRLLSITIALLAAILLPQAANAAWSKASSKFTYDGVSVQVVDRRDQIGRSHSNTYGYADYQNRNDVKVTVNWRCFGVLKDSHKLVLLNDDSFDLAPGEKRGEVYSYRAGKYQYKDFEKYVVSIEVIKEKALETEEPLDPETVTGKNADQIYNKLVSRMGNYTQDDYALAIEWMTFVYTSSLASAYHSDSDLPPSLQGVAMRFAKIAEYVTDADEAGKLNSENKAMFVRLKAMVD